MSLKHAFASWVFLPVGLVGLVSLAPVRSHAVSHAISHRQSEAPAFCSAQYFEDHRIDLKKELGSGTVDKLEVAHAFKLPGFTLAGLAVGESDLSAIKKLAKKVGGVSSDEKYCTWYLNKETEKRKETFNWKYFEYPIENVVNPAPDDDEKYTVAQIKKFYIQKFAEILDQADNSFASCMEHQNFLALGCDGMMHRGPTVFAMLLSFAGCSPKMSVDYAIKLWGENEIDTKVRYQIAELAAKLGREKPALRARLQKLF